MEKEDKTIIFDTRKNFAEIRLLGAGGTGETRLLMDKTTGMRFAFKKYVPKDKEHTEEYYKRFVDEIIILFKLSHPNIVRVYNYYLYPHVKTGYLQMEYIDGVEIDQYEPTPKTKDWNDIFAETVSAFGYLEKNKILHRDIRPANILIDNDANVKIIDFGFGKQLRGEPDEENSILLNWPASEMPDEVQLEQEYNHGTEVYFVGTLFRRLLKNTTDFQFHNVVEKMTRTSPSERYGSFRDVVDAMSSPRVLATEFSGGEKEAYRRFADSLVQHIKYYIDEYMPITQISVVLSRLAELLRMSALEDYIQDNRQLIRCFISGAYCLSPERDIKLQTVIDFYDLVTGLPETKQKIVFDNIYNRLSAIETREALPF